MAKFDFEKSVEELAEKMFEELKPMICFISDITKEFFDYPDKNVIRLALFSKKSRTRKKEQSKDIKLDIGGKAKNSSDT